MNTMSMKQTTERTKEAMTVLSEMPKEELADMPSCLKKVDHLNMHKSDVSRLRKLIASGAKPEELSLNETKKLAAKLPRTFQDVVAGKSFTSHESPKKSKIKKGRKYLAMKRAGEVRKKKAVADGHAREKLRVKEPTLTVGPPNMPQALLATRKKLAVENQKYSIAHYEQWTDQNGQAWDKTTFMLEVTQPLGFVGKPTGVPQKPNRC